MKKTHINVIGAGLAGSEAAYQIAKRGIPLNYTKCEALNKPLNTKQINLLN